MPECSDGGGLGRAVKQPGAGYRRSDGRLKRRLSASRSHGRTGHRSAPGRRPLNGNLERSTRQLVRFPVQNSYGIWSSRCHSVLLAATCWTRILVLTCTNGCSCWSPLEEIWAWFVVVSDTRYHLRHTPILTIYTIHSEVRRVGGAQCSVPPCLQPSPNDQMQRPRQAFRSRLTPMPPYHQA